MKFGMHRVIDHLRPVTIIKIETQRRFPQNGDKLPKFVVFCTISTIKDEKSASKFHYIKTVNCLSSGINILTGVAPFP